MAKKKAPKETSHDQKLITSILKDFEACLDFIGSNGGVPSSGKNGLFSISILPELNEKMTRPLKIDLARPVQKSYPNLNGLYMLLRSTGLVIQKIEGKKQLLVLDDKLLDSWKALNKTERYFSLLRAWLWNSDEEIIGERSGRDAFHLLEKCMLFFENISEEDMERTDKASIAERLKYSPGLHNLALMQLFGMVEISSSPPLPGKGWEIDRVSMTEWGMFLAMNISESIDNYFDMADDMPDEEYENFDAFECFSPIVRPFFKDWNNLLEISGHEFRDSIHIFKVSLGKAWIRFAVPGSCNMDKLANFILNEFDFDKDHLYSFIFKDRRGVTTQVNHAFFDELDGAYAKKTKVGDLPISAGTPITFLYDYGDNWEFKMLLEDTASEIKVKTKNPALLERKGKAPEQYQDPEEYD